MSVSEEYHTRVGARRGELEQLQRRFVALGNMRLAAGLLIAIVAWLAFGQGWISPWWIAVPLGGFAGLLVVHETVARRRKDAARALRFFERGVARLEDRWQGTGSGGEEFRTPDHIYADDLDVFGRGSLFELLNTARTRAGEHTLAHWLLAPASIEEAKARQEAIAELRPRLDLREALALLGEDVRAGLHTEMLARWASQPAVGFAMGSRVAAFLLAASTTVSLVAFFSGYWRLTPFLASLLVELTWLLFAWPRIRSVLEGMEAPAKDLDVLSAILKRIEREEFRAPLLAGLRERMRAEESTASQRIAALHGLVVRLDWARNQLFAPIALFLLWHLHIAIAIERWREISGRYAVGWIEAVGELEALCALASYSYEHPDCVSPALSDEPLKFEATGLAHPLLPASAAVGNDVRLGDTVRLLIVSGSNMSGKSTLMRAVGLNTVLAWAGSPVRASSLAVSRVQVGASIRIVDSLLDGKSRFYAEITRLRQLADAAGREPPLLFLIDEMLSGTNSHDRRIGAEAVLRSLVEAGAIGIVTTHDLALADMAAGFGGRAHNFHFEDTMDEGKLSFDYNLRDGVVTRSNALELMRGLGLKV